MDGRQMRPAHLGVLSVTLLFSAVDARSAPSSVSLLGGRSSTAVRQGINPELEPESDKKFFKKDYPDDTRPHVHNNFGYPYPAVQDTEKYDEDFVADKNNDNGYWKAQSEYDRLKNKVGKEKHELQRALENMKQKKEELDEAKKHEAAADAKATEAEKVEKDKDDTANGAARHDDSLKGEIDAGADLVEKEVNDLEECKRQLAAAKERLKALLQEKEESENKEGSAIKDQEAAGNKADAAKKVEEDAEKKVKEEKQEHEEAEQVYKQELQDVKKAEDDLEKAAEKLRTHRQDSVDGNGGVTTKSLGVRASVAITPLLSVLAALMCAM